MALISNIVQGIGLEPAGAAGARLRRRRARPRRPARRTSIPTGTLAVVLPRGQFPVPGSAGYSWYGMFKDDQGEGSYAEALAELDDLLDEQADALGLAAQRVDRRRVLAGRRTRARSRARSAAIAPGPKAALAMSPALDTAAFDLDERERAAGARAARHARSADPGAADARSRPPAAHARRADRVPRVPDGASGRAREPARRDATGWRRSTRASGPTSRFPTIRSSSCRRSRPRSGKPRC